MSPRDSPGIIQGIIGGAHERRFPIHLKQDCLVTANCPLNCSWGVDGT